jgi:hypothetical protein
MMPGMLRQLLMAATGQGRSSNTMLQGGNRSSNGSSGGAPSSRRMFMDLAEVAAAHRGSGGFDGASAAAAAAGSGGDAGLSSSVLDVLAQVHATVQREVLAAITLNATFADLVLTPVQVRRTAAGYAAMSVRWLWMLCLLQ